MNSKMKYWVTNPYLKNLKPMPARTESQIRDAINVIADKQLKGYYCGVEVLILNELVEELGI